jgi:hypothetical protein
MTNLGLTGAVALAIALAAPAMAASGGRATHGVHREVHDLAIYRMPAQDFDHFDLGIARPAYHSGGGGPYGDGEYPGTIDANMGPPYWSAR